MAEEKVSKININGQDYLVKDAEAREAIKELQKIIENPTLIPVDINDVFELPNGAAFSGSYGYCYQMGKMLFVNCVILGLNITVEEAGIEIGTGITIKNEYFEKMEHSPAFSAQALLQKNDDVDICGEMLIINMDRGPDERVTLSFPQSAVGAEVPLLTFSGVIPLTKE